MDDAEEGVAVAAATESKHERGAPPEQSHPTEWSGTDQLPGDRDPDLTRDERQASYDALDADAPTLDEDGFKRQTRRSLLVGGAAAALGYLGFNWLQNRPEDNNIPDLLRAGHEANEALWTRLSRQDATAPTFPRTSSSMLRVNGRHGIESEIDLDSWTLTVLGPGGEPIGTHTIDEITALPKHEMTVEHKCVEGWKHVVTWGGARFSDFAAQYDGLLGGLPAYVYMVTPDEEYYVGVDRESMLNPQAYLAYELQGQPLEIDHGAPLRLALPNKYGIKQIKRIGTIQFTDDRPTDYWYERGYDWYAQL
jgi:DMSO/TMAO reductase YedYZ molybdopterin-dependent catalytic subunit